MTLLCCIKSSNLPHFEILGAPIGDYLYCANFISSKRQQAARLLSRLEGDARIDPQVALLLLRICAGFCKLVHLARTTPPRLASESLLLFDDDVRHCFSSCAVIDIPDRPVGWLKARSYGFHSHLLDLLSSFLVFPLASQSCMFPPLHHNDVSLLCHNHVPPCGTTTMFSLVSQPCSPLVSQPQTENSTSYTKKSIDLTLHCTPSKGVHSASSVGSYNSFHQDSFKDKHEIVMELHGA